MKVLEFLNKAEERIKGSQTEESLQHVGLWIKEQMQHDDEYKEVRQELAEKYKAKLQELRNPLVNIYLKKWIAQEKGVPRELRVEIQRETQKAILVKGHAVATPTSNCRVCGRQLTHPVSVLYGIGPECGQHFHIPQNEEDVEKIRSMIEAIEFEGWLPKSQVVILDD